MLNNLASLLLPGLVGVGLIALAIVVAKTGWQHRHNRFFAALYFLSGTKSISDGLLAGDGVFYTIQTANGPLIVEERFAEAFHAVSPLFPDVLLCFYVNVVCLSFMLVLLPLLVLNFPRPVPWAVRWPRGQLLLLLLSPLVAAITIYVVFYRPGAQEVLKTILNTTGALVGVFAVYLLLRTRKTGQPIERKQAGYVLAGLLPGIIVTLLIAFSGNLPFAFGSDAATLATIETIQLSLQNLASPPLELAAAAFFAFAILKYRILNFELRVKGGLRYAFMTVILGALLFVVEVYVGNFVLQNQVFSFLGPAGSAALAGITGIVLFKPVHKLSGLATDRLFPDAAKPKEDYTQTRSGEIYRAQVTHVLRDGNVSEKEWAFLRTLRDQLGIKEAAARRIEEEVERSLKVDSPLTGATATTAVHHVAQASADLSATFVEVQRASPLPGPPAPIPSASKPAPAKAAATPKPAQTPKPAASAKAKKPSKPATAAKSPKPGKTPK